MKVILRISLTFSLLCCTSLAFSNPIPVYIINEFQTSPDSLQRIELHWSVEDFSFYPETLLGWKIVTSYGTATIDTSLVLDSNYVVIDSTNTSGVFKLGEIRDTIEIIAVHEHGESIVEYLSYPEYAPTPPPGASACHLVCDCSTPTEAIVVR